VRLRDESNMRALFSSAGIFICAVAVADDNASPEKERLSSLSICINFSRRFARTVFTAAATCSRRPSSISCDMVVTRSSSTSRYCLRLLLLNRADSLFRSSLFCLRWLRFAGDEGGACSQEPERPTYAGAEEDKRGDDLEPETPTLDDAIRTGCPGADVVPGGGATGIGTGVPVTVAQSRPP